MENGQYYLGRVIKLGSLNQAKLLDAIVQCPPRSIGKFSWAITDIVDDRNGETPYVFGKLSKYSAEGAVTIVDPNAKHQIPAIARNLLIASSPFVYLPNYSGIAYLHVWNEIQDDVFPRRFKTLIESVFDAFFVECSIEPISDYRAFSAKLREIETISQISARVYPPNPLFGRIWRKLRTYLKERNASEVLIREQNKAGEALNSRVVEIVTQIVEEKPIAESFEADISDAAILMAADGYGEGKVSGFKKDERITVRTSDSRKSFMFSKDPDPLALAKLADSHFTRISDERRMEHP